MATTRAIRRRRHFEKDTRPDWRDPNMKVWRPLQAGGHGWLPACAEVDEARAGMQQNPAPTWKNDPSYWWARKKPPP